MTQATIQSVITRPPAPTRVANPHGLSNRKTLEPFLYDDVVFYPHQVEGTRRLARMGNSLLADQMGLGKSLQALTVFAIDVVRGKAKTLLIVCPVSLRGNWADEIEKFTNFKYTLLGDGASTINPSRRIKLKKRERETQISEFKLSTGPRILICNYEQVDPHVDSLRSAFDTIIFDEAHVLKNPKSRRTKAAMSLNAKRKMLLTGTPMLNRVDELWTLLHMISPVTWPTYERFRNRYCVYGGYKGSQIVGTKNTAELNNVLARVMVRRLKKDVLPLPAPRIMQVKVDLHPTQEELYNMVADEYFVPFASGADFIDNPLTKLLRLKQICGSPAVFEGYSDDSYKLDHAVDIVCQQLNAGEKVVVFTQFRSILDLFVKRLKAAGVDKVGRLHGGMPSEKRMELIRRWSAWPHPAPIVCMVQVAGVGLNMTAARVCVFLDKLFVPGLNMQAVDRLHRIGASETQPVDVYEMLARGTIETRIEQILKGKTKDINNVVEESLVIQQLLNHERALRKGTA